MTQFEHEWAAPATEIPEPRRLAVYQELEDMREALERAYLWLAEISVLSPIYDREPEKAMRLAAMQGRDEARRHLYGDDER